MGVSWVYIFLIAHLQRLVEIPINQKDEVYKIRRLKLTIVDADSTYVRAILSDKEIERVENLGYRVKVIYDDYRDYYIYTQDYHSYEEVINEMINVATTYPNITLLDTIGYSVEGRLVLGLKVSDSAIVHQNEPGIRFTGCHHGNEHISTELILYLMRYLTENYATIPMIKRLVDTREIWLIPMVNPDGVVYSSRENANGVDLNRDYGYMWEGWGASPAPFSQVETQLMRQNALENRFVLAFDYHSVEEKVNTLWDYTPIFAQDDSLIMDIGKEYADSTGYQLIRGWYWYEVHGSCQDAMYGLEGIINYTIETPQPPNPITIWEDNRGAMLAMINRAGDVGIAGIVTDSITGAPLDARVDIQEIRWPIYTDPRLGDYHRVLLPGTYTVKVYANKYLPKVISNVVVADSVTTLDIALVPGGGSYAHRVVWANVADPNDAYTNHTLTVDVLGAPDDLFLSLGVSGEIVVDMGENTPITDSFTVYEGDDGNPNEGYMVYISNNWNGPFDLIGTYYGTQTFYVQGVTRYVKIKDDGDGNPDAPYAGFDLDAVESGRRVGICEKEIRMNGSSPLLRIYPNPFKNKTVIEVRRLDSTVEIYDLGGRLIKSFTTTHAVWDGRDEFGKEVGAGVYFCKLITSGKTRAISQSISKIIRIR